MIGRILAGVSLAILVSGCSASSSNAVFSVALVIRGTNGHQWSGTVSDDNGVRSEDGKVPAVVDLAATKSSVVGGTIQKHDAGNWELTVCIAVNGIERRCGSTTAESGVVSVQGTVTGSATLE